ncbi:MAG: ABC transporter ATP-binding protein [Euryarchaeota archaeon]|nr:ABC transporter ATP-binding protein [Euryarchaeota archaeon]MDE1835286.1 ABC transporter ATP-binding protein [Euryarchaeota archaeon]MDE1881063.1 ABC transporter ATP-binding protein [Euryarchaeota archaeon]MDE2043582.1 ABC transporter ATP-binding protein [Thermoplasmata archaeon]
MRNGGGEAVLEARDLTKVYAPRRGQPPVHANRGISLTVHKGEVVAVLGPNGAGKSTFLRQVAGQLLPTSGTVRVCGIDVIASPLAAKRCMSVIPQECSPYDSLTVEEHVRYFGIIKGMDPRTAPGETSRLLSEVGLTEHRTKLIRELSGGLKRRVLIALALAGPGNQLLLLDEPTTGLDPASRRTVWKVIESLAGKGRGVLLTTHYIDEAEYLADRIVIIAQGRILAEGSPLEIQSRSASKGRLDIYDVDLLSAAAKAELDSLKGVWPVSFAREDHLRLAVPDPFSPEAVARLQGLSGLGVKATLAPASLEDAYLTIAGEMPET